MSQFSAENIIKLLSEKTSLEGKDSLDSLTIMKLVIAAESVFAISFSRKDFSKKISTLDEFTEIILRKL